MTASTPADTISTVAIAALLDVTPATITNWKTRKDDFPEPVAGTTRSPLYDRQQVFRWLIANGKATDNKLRGAESEGTAFQLMDLIRNIGLDTEVLSAAICYTHLSRNGTLTEPARWAHQGDNEMVGAVLAASEWSRASAMTHGFDVFRPLIQLVDSSRNNAGPLYAVLDRLRRVEDLPALHNALEYISSKGDTSLPVDVAACIAQLLPASVEQVVDPYCTGPSLLMACAREYPESDLLALSPSRFALESSLRAALVADLNLNAVVGDIVGSDTLSNVRAEAVVCNPPWGMRIKDRGSVRDTDPRWTYGTPRGDMYWAVLQDAVHRLQPGGRAVVICPSSVLINTTGGARGIREGLLRHGSIEAVIAAPRGTLHNTALGFCILVLSREGETADRDHVLLVDLPKPRGRGSRPDFADAVQAYRRWIAGRAINSENAFRASISDILSSRGTMEPAKWREAANRPGADALVATLDLAQKRLDTTLAENYSAPAALKPRIADTPRLATIGSLTGLAIHRGASLDRRVHDTARDTGTPVLTLSILNSTAPLTEDIRYVDADTVRGRVILTEPGDIVAHPTPNGIVAKVWNEAGWLLNSHAELLRISDTTVFDPDYLVLCLSSRLITEPVTVGSVIPRAQVKNVTIPLITIADQRNIAAHSRQLNDLRLHGARISRESDNLRRALADVVGSGIVLTP
ncbi:N-6 DNA methylase [Rhodococcoides fascians]|uniref:N-6 DNA methylase n=1 Tax=Rhodococcoides fascians TaxID=1828 RepID=UPI001DB90649|nr:N-6 DNA methylase [Rhodococcus fascians]CAH0230319.1 Type I restriction enzyme EcoKI M protein [Rhodococcus fascians]